MTFRHSLILLLAILAATASAHAQVRDLFLTPETTTAPRRVALVIGNDAYKSAPLQNAVADAKAIAAALRGLDFHVTLVENASRAALANAVSAVADNLRAEDVVLMFYAGHGMQIEGENYLIPVDFAATSATSARLSAFAASELEAAFSKARVSMLVLDACRTNPYSGDRGATGLAQMEARGTLVAFAAGAGQTASDNLGASNGLFTQELLKGLAQPNVSVRELLFGVRQRVYQASNGRQFPAVYDGLIGDVVLRQSPSGDHATSPAPSALVPVAANTPAANSGPQVDPAEVALWNAIEKSTRASDYEVYLKQYPNGVFAALARSRMSDTSAPVPPRGNAAELPFEGSAWSGKMEHERRKKYELFEDIALSFEANGRGTALYGLKSRPFAWTKVGNDVVITMPKVSGTPCSLRFRGTLEGDTLSGEWSDDGGSTCIANKPRWTVTRGR